MDYIIGTVQDLERICLAIDMGLLGDIGELRGVEFWTGSFIKASLPGSIFVQCRQFGLD